MIQQNIFIEVVRVIQNMNQNKKEQTENRTNEVKGQKQYFIDYQHFYYFQPSAKISFDNFNKSSKISRAQNQQYFKQISLSQFQLDKFLSIKIEESLRISLIAKDQAQKWSFQQLILQNPFGADLYLAIVEKVQKQKDNLTNNLVQKQIFNKNLKKSGQHLLSLQLINSPDICVKDIYGQDSSAIGLPPNLIAASLGKLNNIELQQFKQEQILRQSLVALAINAAQLIGLASLKYKIDKLVVLRNNLGLESFNRFIYTLLDFYNPNAQIYFPCQE